jgi:serine protease Do
MIYLSSFDGKNNNIAFRVMRTDASVNHGNSGGGLFDINGKLIGITNAKNVEEETDNICYALPITLVKYLMENIRDNMQSGKAGYVSCATVGIQTRLMESSVYLDEQGELALKERFYVDKVTEGSAADGVLKPMDIIQSITINGVTTELTRRYLWNDLLLTIRKGDSVQITVLRDSKTEDKKEEVVLTLTFNRDSDFVKFA